MGETMAEALKRVDILRTGTPCCEAHTSLPETNSGAYTLSSSDMSPVVNYLNQTRSSSTYVVGNDVNRHTYSLGPDSRKNYSYSKLAGVVVKEVPRYKMQNNPNILGMAFPKAGLVQILDELSDNQKREVELHELVHIAHPNMNEKQVRNETHDMIKNMGGVPELNHKYLEMPV
jgi:hypothetical protein